MRKFALGFVILGMLAFQTASLRAGVSFGLHGNALNFKLANDIVAKVSGSQVTSTQGLALQEVYGLGLGGGLHLDFSLPIISFRVSGDYLTLSPDNSKFQSLLGGISPLLATATVDGGRITMIGGSVNLKLNILPLPVIKPYATGGVGLTNLKMDDVNVKTPLGSFSSSLLKTQTAKTFNVGAGVDIELGGIALFAELKVNWVFLEEGTSVQLPIGTVGITF
jgi:opacity protein-like surface antigen